MTEFLQMLQSFSTPALDTFFLVISALTGELVYFLILGYFYWCRDKKSAFSAAIIMIGSFTVNCGLKNLFKIPRPFEYAPVRQIDVKTGYGYSFPSGHAQLSTTFAGVSSAMLKKRWAYISGVALVVLTGLSRMYLGVHTPVDILFGIITGAAVTALGLLILKNDRYIAPVSVIVVVATIILSVITGDEDLYKMSGMATGFVAGYFADCHFIHFDTSGTRIRKLVRFITGVVLVALVKVCISAIFADKFIQYAAIGLTFTAIIPLLCKFEKTIYK